MPWKPGIHLITGAENLMYCLFFGFLYFAYASETVGKSETENHFSKPVPSVTGTPEKIRQVLTPAPSC